MHGLDRSQFLRLGAAAALATVAGAATAPAAGAIGPPPAPQGDDVGFVQWGATAELVAVAFWDRALDERGLGERARRWMRAVREADAGHLRQLSTALGEEAPTAEDFKVVLPRRAFKSRARILALGEEIEEQTTRVYLGGVSQAIDPATRLLLGQLLVNDTQHFDSLRSLAGESSAFAGLRDPLELEPAGRWLDGFLRVRSS